MADKVIDVPGVGTVSFPGDMSDDAISGVLVQQYGGGAKGGASSGQGQSSGLISPPPGTPTIPRPDYSKVVDYPTSGLVRNIDAAGAQIPTPSIKGMNAANPLGQSDIYTPGQDLGPNPLTPLIKAIDRMRGPNRDISGGMGEIEGQVLPMAGGAVQGGMGSLLRKATEGGVAPRTGAAIHNLSDSIPDSNIMDLARHPVRTIAGATAKPIMSQVGKMLTKDPFLMDREFVPKPGGPFQSNKGDYPYSIFDDTPQQPAPIHQSAGPAPILQKQGPRKAVWQGGGGGEVEDTLANVPEPEAPPPASAPLSKPRPGMARRRGYQESLDDQAVREEVQQRLGLSEEGAESIRRKEFYAGNKPGTPKSILTKKAKAGK